MDIYKVGQIFYNPIKKTTTNRSHSSADKDSSEGSGQHHRDENANQEQAKQAADILAKGTSFKDKFLSIEVREFDGRYFLDVFDNRHQKVKTINGTGIHNILESQKQSTGGESKAQILDQKV